MDAKLTWFGHPAWYSVLVEDKAAGLAWSVDAHGATTPGEAALVRFTFGARVVALSVSVRWADAHGECSFGPVAVWDVGTGAMRPVRI